MGEPTQSPQGPWIDLAGSRVPDAPSPVPQREPSRDRRWLLIVGGLVAAWLAFVGLGRLASPDEAAQIPRPAPTLPPMPAPAPTVQPTPLPTAPPPATPTPELAVPPENVGVAQLGARMESTVQVERMVRQLGRRGSDAVLAYRAADGIVLVDLAAGTADVVTPTIAEQAIAPQYVLARGEGHFGIDDVDLRSTDVLLRAAGETVAIDPITLDVRLVSADASLIVTDTRLPEVFWVPGRDLQGQAAEVLALIDDASWWFRAPHATQLIAFDGFGLVAVGKGLSGGTWWAGETEFVAMSPHRVFDANGVAVLEEVCGDATCVFEVRHIDPDPDRDGDPDHATWRVPDGFVDVGDRLELSPDGGALLRHDPYGFAEVYDSRDQSISWITGASMHHGVWDPASSFVAWIDLLGSPELRVMFLDERDWLRIDLDDMGLPRPIGTELVVFDAGVADEGEPEAS